MSGISSTLSIAKSAISVQQYGLNITGQNIANVNNPNYSVQSAEHKNRTPAPYAGFLFGTGVDMYQVKQNVDEFLEQRLTAEISTQSSFEEQESYMRVLEGFFDVSSETSISNVMTEFWNSWHDLSNNPEGSAERVLVLENGKQIAASFETAILSMDALSLDMTMDIETAVSEVNQLTSQIAQLNGDIGSSEIGRTANDLRDQRNRLLDELGNLINITTYEHADGSVTVNAVNNFTIVSKLDTSQLGMQDGQVTWENSTSGTTVISDKITGGRIGGLLEMRDEVMPNYRAEVNVLAREMIWAVNYQHSQGSGLEYLSEPVVGDYATGDNRWLSSYEFGDKIDPSREFVMWMEEKISVDTEYTQINMDMNLSEAGISDWSGTTPGGIQSTYRLTVVDEAVLGDKVVTETDGDGLAEVHGGGATVSEVLDTAISPQTVTVYGGPSGTGVINVKDLGGDARRSAASIADALNTLGGVTAYASQTSAEFSTAGIANAQDNDEIRFSLYVDGIIQEQSFIRDSSQGSVQDQFEDALLAAAAAVNNINEDKDLFAGGLTLTSLSGKTLGVQDFEVQDNAGIRLSGFSGFSTGETLGFEINGIPVSVDLTGVDTSDAAVMASTFYAAVDLSLQDQPFTVENDVSSNAVVIRTSDGSGITLGAVSALAGDPTILISTASGTSITGDNTLTFDGADSVAATADIVDTDTILFSGNGSPPATVIEATAAGVDKAAVITGTITIELDQGMSIQTSVLDADPGGLFDTSKAKTGSSILTLGGEGGFTGFTSAGAETISFDLDGNTIFFSKPAPGTSDPQMATLLAFEINTQLAGFGVDQNYQVISTASSVSILKDSSLEDPIRIENFSDPAGNLAELSVRTGTGTGISQPENDRLYADPSRSYRNSTTSSLYSDSGIIRWERLDKDGIRTGASGLVSVEDEGRVVIVEEDIETVSFNISKGSLVAGNTLTVNTDTSGHPDPLNFRMTGRANSINDVYQFTIVSGGKVGHLPGADEAPLVIEWTSSSGYGNFTIEGDDPPYTPETPVEVVVDGMNLKFYDGTLFSGDSFTITTGDTGIPVSQNSDGQPTGETLSDWHWTIDSFADQFNRIGVGINASATLDNRLEFGASDTYYAMENIAYSGANGFVEENISISVENWSAIDFKAADLRFERSSTGDWGFLNDPTGGTARILPEGGDDNGFGVDLSGDGLADIRVDFRDKVSGKGYVEFDFQKRASENIGFAFSDDASSSSGLAAAAGINTFFKGDNAMTMDVNAYLSDTRRVAAASIDSMDGRISQGDNANALAMADVQFQDRKMTLWTYERGVQARSSVTTTSIDNYYTQLMGAMGVTSRSIKNSKAFADIMVSSITEQRNAVSSVSLDEEMIKLMQYQHAFSAASKLLTVSDEMLNTLINMR